MKYHVAIIGVVLVIIVLLLNNYSPSEDNLLHPALINDIKEIARKSPLVNEFISNNPSYEVSVESIEDEKAEDVIGIGPWDKEGNKKYYQLIFKEKGLGSSVFVIVEWNERKVAYNKQNEPERLCMTTDKRCQNDNVQECSEDGKSWISVEECEQGCNETSVECISPPEIIRKMNCTPYERICNETHILECSVDGLIWDIEERCEYNCSNLTLECNPEPEVEEIETFCEPGARKCYFNTLQQCYTNGSAWFDVENCRYGCRNGKCEGGTEIDVCSDPDEGINESYLPTAAEVTKSISGLLVDSKNDYCDTEYILMEAYCSGTSIEYKQIDCVYGCLNNQCKTSDNSTA